MRLATFLSFFLPPPETWHMRPRWGLPSGRFVPARAQRSQVTGVTMYPFCQAEVQKGNKYLIINTLTIYCYFPYHFVLK